jgi:glycosyltransferase involved in cell wall biosynthesis
MADRLAKRGVPKARLRTILNAWSPSGTPADRLAARRALALPVDGTVVGWVGRLTHEKGADVLLDAFASAPALPPRLSIVGAGPELDALQVQARSRGLEGRVQWHGFVPDAGQLLSAFDVFVLSSRTEGTPIALFEAMAAGVPIVATSVGGVPDVITDAEALLVPPEDPLALATAIRRVVDDPRVAAQRAAAARLRLAEKFAVDPWLSAYENVYRSVARGPRSPT